MYFKIYNKIVFATLLAIVCCFSHEVELSSISKESVIHAAQCGGNLDGDSGSIVYPGPGFTLQPGELCVWTVHTITTRDFKLNFTSFNVNSNDNNCANGGVRIYSLTNLAPVGNIQEYTFCDSKPSDSTFFLGNNVLVVVLYTGDGNSNAGSGIQLNWEGSAYDSLRTKHLSNLATANQAIIRYPTFGNYEPNLAGTWLVTTQSESVDLDFSNIDLESCSDTQNKCTCDALIVYEVSQAGILDETDRICGDRTSAVLSNLPSNFIVAFFSDFETKPGGGTGFNGNYYPSGSASPTTTRPTVETTTSEDSSVISTNCGETLSLVGFQKGIISYKPDEEYDANLRCVWTIRIRNARGISFDLAQSGIDTTGSVDGLSISMFTRADPPLLKTQLLRNEGVVTLNGSVAIVTFQTDASNQGRGFELNFAATEFVQPNISFYSSDYISTGLNGSISYPPNGGNYTDRELTTFVIGDPDFSLDSGSTKHVTWTLRGLENNCYDYVVLFKYYTDAGWSQYDLYCATSPKTTTHTDMLLYVFLSSTSGVDTGFTFDWYSD